MPFRIPKSAFLADFGPPFSFHPGNARNNVNQGLANRASYSRTHGGAPITAIGFVVVTSSGNVDVGSFSASGMAPGDRNGSSGSTACPAAGYAEVSLGGSVVHSPGDFLALAVDNTTAEFRSPGTASDVVSGMWAGFGYFENSAFPLPASAAATAGSARVFFLRGVV